MLLYFIYYKILHMLYCNYIVYYSILSNIFDSILCNIIKIIYIINIY